MQVRFGIMKKPHLRCKWDSSFTKLFLPCTICLVQLRSHYYYCPQKPGGQCTLIQKIFYWSRQQLFIKWWSIIPWHVTRQHFQHFKEMMQVPVSQWTNSANWIFRVYLQCYLLCIIPWTEKKCCKITLIGWNSFLANSPTILSKNLENIQFRTLTWMLSSQK